MIQYIYAVQDSAARAFASPIFVPAPGVMTRMIGEEVNRVAADNPLHKHSADFTVYCLGTYDTDTGVITPQTPELVHRCVDLKIPA